MEQGKPRPHPKSNNKLGMCYCTLEYRLLYLAFVGFPDARKKRAAKCKLFFQSFFTLGGSALVSPPHFLSESGWGDADKDLIWTQKRKRDLFCVPWEGSQPKQTPKTIHGQHKIIHLLWTLLFPMHGHWLDNGLKRKINMAKIWDQLEHPCLQCLEKINSQSYANVWTKDCT